MTDRTDPIPTDPATPTAPGPTAASPRPSPVAAPTRAEMAADCRDEVAAAGAALLDVLHDIDAHYYPRLHRVLDDEVTDTAYGLVERVLRIALRTVEDIGAATARRNWLLAGGPLRCGSCGDALDPVDEPWQVCSGHAEHDICHQADPTVEAERRAWRLEQDEYQAHLDDHIRSGPRERDRVRLTYRDGTTAEGTWLCDCHDAVRVDGPDGRTGWDGTVERDITTRAAVEVTELAEDWQ